MSKLFAECLNSVLYDSRPGKKMTAERLQEISGISKWTIYKWSKDENTETINQADHLSRILDDLGESRLIESRLSAKSSVIRLAACTVDGDVNPEVKAVVCALHRVIESFPVSKEEGIKACQEGMSAFANLMEEFRRL